MRVMSLCPVELWNKGNKNGHEWTSDKRHKTKTWDNFALAKLGWPSRGNGLPGGSGCWHVQAPAINSQRLMASEATANSDLTSSFFTSSLAVWTRLYISGLCSLSWEVQDLRGHYTDYIHWIRNRRHKTLSHSTTSRRLDFNCSIPDAYFLGRTLF